MDSLHIPGLGLGLGGDTCVAGMLVGSFGLGMMLIFIICMPFLIWIHSISKPIPGIPIIPANSFLGYSTFSNRKSHIEMRNNAKIYGPIAQFYLLGYHFVAIFDSQLAKQLLTQTTGKGAPMHRPADPRLTDKNIFNVNTDKEWAIRHKVLRGAFTTAAMQLYVESVRMLSAKVADVIAQAAAEGSLIDVDELFSKLTMDIICKVAFQYDLQALSDSDEFDGLHENTRLEMENAWMSILPWAYYLTKYLPFEPFAGYYKGKMYAQAFNGKILAHIRMLRASGDLNPSSVGARLLQLQDEHGVSDREVMSEIHIIFIAGHETTAHTLSYFCYSIAMNPIVQQRCQTAIDKWMAAPESTLKRSEGSSEEANQPIGTSTGTSPELIPEYVEAVLKESMRRYPVAGQGSVRQVKKPDGCTLHYAGEDGTKTVYKIPKGTWTITSFYALHNAIENWGQSALEFIPERFLPNYGHDGQPVKKQAWVYAERKEREETSNAANVLEESVRSKSGVPCARSTTPLANKHSEPTGHASGRNDDAEMVIQDFPLDERNEERNGSSDGEGDVGRHGGDEEAEHVEGEYILRRPTTDMLGKGFPARIDMKADTSQANIFMPTSLPKKTSSNVNPLSTPSIYMGGGSVPEELTFSPFSHGPRRCLGYTLALLELRVAIAELVKRFNFEVADETMRDESVAFENATTLRPRGKWLLKVTAR